MNKERCVLINGKEITAKTLAEEALKQIKDKRTNKINAIWLEASGCSGNIISFMNSENPDLINILTQLVDLKFNNSLMSSEGNRAFQQFVDTLDTEFILLVEGAVSTKGNGFYNIIANYKGRYITALEGVKMAGEKAKYVISVGTCASYGGVSAASPNPADCKSVVEILNREVIRVPGCPTHPDWVVGTLAHLISYGIPALDNENRPLLFYGVTIHDSCSRRGYFDKKVFAEKLGDTGCMLKLGCRGPVTKTDCPSRKWNGYVNWPVGANATCIGCAQPHFPDGMEPFTRY